MMDPDDLHCHVKIFESDCPEMLDEFVNKAYEMMVLMKSMRDVYKKSNKLPLYYLNSDYENVMNILHILENEAMKFNVPMYVTRSYEEIPKKELRKILKDREETLQMGLDEWVEEGLL